MADGGRGGAATQGSSGAGARTRPILRAADVAPCVLGAAIGCRLGHDSFVLTRPATADRSDLAYLAPFSD